MPNSQIPKCYALIPIKFELLLPAPAPPTLTMNFLTTYSDGSVGGFQGDFTEMYAVPSPPEGSLAVNLNIPRPWFKLVSPPPTDTEISPLLYRKPRMEDLTHQHLTVRPWAAYLPSGDSLSLSVKWRLWCYRPHGVVVKMK